MVIGVRGRGTWTLGVEACARLVAVATRLVGESSLGAIVLLTRELDGLVLFLSGLPLLGHINLEVLAR